MKAGWYRTVLLALGFNLALALTFSVLAVWYSQRPVWSVFRSSFLPNWIYSNAIGGVCFLLLPILIPRFWHTSAVARWSLLVCVLLVLNLAGCILATGVLMAIYEIKVPFWTYVIRSYRYGVPVTIFVGIMGTLFESWRHRIERANLELKQRQIEHERALKLASEAQLASIESRIQPHFLFNALNSISALIKENPDHAEKLIERLSRILRSSLDTHASLVPLRQEIKLTMDYLEIQTARFGSRLRYSCDVSEDLAEWLVPPFSVQTLVENSVKYAVAPRHEGGRIAVTARRAGEKLHLEVSDDGPGFEAGAMAPGHGLDNLHVRLLTLFGLDAALNMRRREPGMTVSVSLPLKPAYESVSG